MKKLFCLMALAVFFAGVRLYACTASYADVDPANAETMLAAKLEAQDLKAEALKAITDGNMVEASSLYVQAATKHPETLCQASYTWQAAMCLVAHKNASNDWAINTKITQDQATEALSLLTKAETLDRKETPYCSSGVNKENLLRIIKLNRKWISFYTVSK